MAGGVIWISQISGGAGNITGNFIGNYSTGWAQGVAIYNESWATTSDPTRGLGDITGNFIGNYSDDSGTAGAIYNNHGTIGNITGDFIEQFLCQMRIQYIVELVALLENLSEEKMTFMNYVNKTYKLEDVDSCYSRLANIVKKDSLEVYGTLLRQISFYPSLTPTDNEQAFCSVLSQLQMKLSSVANNLTAGISEKSMSITIVPLGRSRVYQNIMDKIEGVDGNSSSFAAKLRDKDIIKKIR
jgi:hypothetical protein